MSENTQSTGHKNRTPEQERQRRENIAKARRHFDGEQAHKLAQREDRIGMAQDRPPEEQLARLDRRLGTGSGALRERRRLQARIDAQRGSQSVVEGVAPVPARVKLTPEQRAARKSAKLARYAADLAKLDKPALNTPAGK